jgi:serine/threonine-protein kinase
MAQPHADRNLLFGILALQLDFISRDQLVAAMHAWVLHKHKPLGEILVEQQALAGKDREMVEALVERHLELHDHQPQKSLAALSLGPDLHEDLDAIADADLYASLASLPTVHPHGTAVHLAALSTDGPGAMKEPAAVGEPSSAGLRFRLLRPHAEGGLGQVSVARDQELNRDVALKEIKAEYADQAAARARFLAEAEVTGGLEHPGVVPVYGLGRFDDGRPFYAMRFVQGDSLLEAISRFHAADWKHKPGERALALRGLLRRFVDVCNAVAYAHSRGVLHRDVKPANVLLGPYGETLLVDWGLAKALKPEEGKTVAPEGLLRPSSGAVATQAGAVVGTPGYMAPEQAEAKAVGPAADVYGLGATLYHLLAGQAPFGGPDVVDVLMRVVQGQCRPARAVTALVPAALSAICQKAMALAPQERYGSAKELAADVERWLADEPVLAYREPWQARLARWARRHRLLVASVAVLVLSAVLALTVGIVAVNREQQRTKGALAAESVALAAESQARQRTREALDEMSSQVIEDWLSRRGQLEPAQRAFLEKALAYYEAFAAESGHSKEASQSVADAHVRVGNIRRRLGQHKEAEMTYRRALELGTTLAAEFPTESQLRQLLATTHHNLGNLLSQTGRLKEAEAAYCDALAIQKPLAADCPGMPQYRHELARTTGNLAFLLKTTGHPQEAETAYRDVLDIYKGLTADFTSVPEYRRGLGLIYVHLGGYLADMARPKEAEAAYREAVAVYKRLADDFPAEPRYRAELANCYINLGFLLSNMDRAREAQAAYLGALAILKPLAADFPAMPDYRQQLAGAHNSLGLLLAQTGRGPEAEAAYHDALAIRKRLASDFPGVPQYRQYLAQTHNNLGNLRRDMGRMAEAETACREALEIRKRLAAEVPTVPDYQNELADTLNHLAALARGRKDYASARQLLEEARPHVGPALEANPRHPWYREVFRDHRQLLAATLLELGEHASAVEAAADLARIACEPAKDAYQAACFFSRCIPLAQKDSKLPQAQCQELAKSYAAKALEALRQALAKGYMDATNMKKDKDLDPLRPRDDFQKLLAELEKEAGKEKPKDKRPEK